jgi:adenylate cyclase
MMLELIAQGTDVDSRWRRQLPEQTVELGRATQAYRVPWDNQISRRHVKLKVLKGRVEVQKFPEASNPVFYDGKQETSFLLFPGEHFVIGKTTFTLAADRAFVSLDVPDPISQKTYSHDFLRQVPYRDADRRIDVLNQIPEAISSAGNTEDLLIQMVNTLMAGITTASTIGIVQLNVSVSESNQSEPEIAVEANGSIEIVQWDRRGFASGDFQPSESLIRQAIESDETTLHIWNQRKRAQVEYTYDYENDWAFVSPISSDASPGWGIYVAGTNRGAGSTIDSGSGEEDLQGDIKFCELVGSTLKNLLLVKQLERQQSSLRTFFSPFVMDAFAGRDPDEVLMPRKCDVAVLFCDLRGFSKTSEQMADNLLELLARVSDSLGLMTRKILDHGGVIGDFHGDSAMGFWGWPLEPSAKFESAVAAVETALEIQAEVARNLKSYPDLQSFHLHNFQVGLGIASGDAVAGKIGTQDQVKVTAFGPVVNLASRLEGMTRLLNSCILVDAETVNRIEAGFTDPVKPVTRCLGRFQPFRMESSLDVFQVLPAGAVDDEGLQVFDTALTRFQSGDWAEAKQQLELLPDTDSARQMMEQFLNRHGGVPPEGWNGTIRMQVK